MAITSEFYNIIVNVMHTNLTVLSSSLSLLSRDVNRGALVNLQASPFWKLARAKLKKSYLDRSSGSAVLRFRRQRKRLFMKMEEAIEYNV